MNDKELRDIFSEKLSSLESPVDPGVWAGIQSGITGGVASGGAAAASVWSIAKIGLIAAAATGLAVVTWVMWPESDKPVTTAEVEQTEQPEEVPAENVETIEDASKTSNVEVEDAAQSSESTPAPEHSQNPATEVTPQTNRTEATEASSLTSPATVQSPAENPFVTPNTQSTNTSESAVSSTSVDLLPSAAMITQDEFDPMTWRFSYPEVSEGLTWKFGDGQSAVGSTVTHTFETEGEYQPELFIQGSTEVAKLELLSAYRPAVVVMPNIFTPGSSPGLNDLYDLNHQQSSGISRYILRIFNAQGIVIFESSEAQQAWDGTDRYGNALPAGTYHAVVEAWNANEQRTVSQQTLYLKR